MRVRVRVCEHEKGRIKWLLSRVRVCDRIGCTDTTYRLGCLVLVFRSVVCVCVSCIGSSTRTIDFFRKINSDSDPFVVSVSYSYNC